MTSLRASSPEPAAQGLREAPGFLRRGRARRGGPEFRVGSQGRGRAEAEPGGAGPAAAVPPSKLCVAIEIIRSALTARIFPGFENPAPPPERGLDYAALLPLKKS